MAKAKILLLEPDKDLSMPFINWLKVGNYEARLAHSPEEADTLLSKEKFDMIIMDIDSTEMTEELLEFCQTLKKSDAYSAIPVTMLAYKNDGKQIASTLKAGTDNLIPKPFNADYLISSIERVLEEVELEKKGKHALDLSYADFLIGITSELKREDFFLLSKVIFDKVIMGKIGPAVNEESLLRLAKQTSNLIADDYGFMKAVKFSNTKLILDEVDRVSANEPVEKLSAGFRYYVHILLQLIGAQISELLEERVEERTSELSTLYEVSKTIAYTLDFQGLFKIIMEALFKIVDYDICASLLFDVNTVNITIKPAYSESAGFVEHVKNSIVDSASSMFTAENIRKKNINTFIVVANPDAKPKANREFEKLRSFLNVPFVVGTKTIGLINVSSCEKNAFNEQDVKLIYTVANQASNAIEHLQSVVKAEKSKMESMVESMLEGVVMTDKLNRIIVLNPRARQIFGFGPDAEVSSEALKAKFKAAGLDKLLEECKGWGKKSSVTREIELKGGQGAVLNCNVAPVVDADGEIIGIVTILRDITQEKEVDKIKTEFISTVSHELRTPLSIIKEGINLVLDKIPGDINTKQEKVLTTANENIDRLSRIINSLLDISKIEAGKLELKKGLTDITTLINNVASSFKTRAKGQGIEIKVSVPAEKIDVYADTDKIIQVFTNLINNSLKFTKHGQIEIKVQEGENDVECRVSDTGAGISKEDLPKVFSKFLQFGRTAGAGEKGTGLGLSIIKGIIEMHGGTIKVDSDLGKGATFTFTLPKYTPESFFRELVENGIRDAVRKDSTISIIIVSLRGIEKLKKKLSEKKMYAILKGMEEVLEKALRRAGDVASKGMDEVIILLSECGKENALRVEGRLEQAAEDYLEREKLADAIKLKFGTATYPDDGNNEDEIIKKAKKS